MLAILPILVWSPPPSCFAALLGLTADAAIVVVCMPPFLLLLLLPPGASSVVLDSGGGGVGAALRFIARRLEVLVALLVLQDLLLGRDLDFEEEECGSGSS